jgi:glycosyltransferase involved in cell wall biosynthesis
MISCVILTKNNELTLAKTLRSVAWCDEILVVDDYSDDKTIAVAKKAKARVLRRHLKEDFALQRNAGLQTAKGDWVLFIDSDEIVSFDLQREIQSVTNITTLDGFYIRRLDHIFGRDLLHGETANVRLLRLARKEKGSWERAVHEIWNIKGNVGELNSPLMHFPHPTVRQFLEEINIYTTINAHYYFAHNVRTSVWQIIFYPPAKFAQNYIFRLGFLDDTPGMIVALLMSFHSFLTRGKLFLLWQKKSKQH